MHYLVIVYRYSGWPLVKPLKKLDTTAMTSTLEDWFLDYGKPVDIRSDGGPQFHKEFDIWYKEQKIKHQSSSAYNHQSNGHAEVAVREMKHSFKKTGSFMESRRALREWRNTPRFDRLSPSQWLTRYRQKTNTVAAPNVYRRITDRELKVHKEKRREVREKAIEKVPSCTLEPLKPGQKVLVQCPKTSRWSIPAMIKSRHGKTSYLVRTNSSGQFLRNRKFLRPCPGPMSHGPGPTSNGPSLDIGMILRNKTNESILYLRYE